MRIIFLSLTLSLSGCAAMLLGSGNGGGPSGEDARSSAQVEADAAITSSVRLALASDSMLRRYDLAARTANGRVTLHGSVDSYPARARAGELAAGVEGVASVNNRIRVAAGH